MKGVVCGIFGLWDRSEANSTRLLRAVAERLAHRGPDDAGYWLGATREGSGWSAKDEFSHPDLDLPHVDEVANRAWDLALVHRRLSIIDTSPSGHQPMVSSDGDHVLAYNGEIYNYVELRRELEKEGAEFRSTSDTEVLLLGLRSQGIDFLRRAVGMFAFAWIDLAKGELVLARDFFGIKPLFFAQKEGTFAFASEIPALLEVPWVSRHIDPQRSFDYLRFGLSDHDSGSFFGDIRRLPPAHFLRLSLEGSPRPSPEPYWSLNRESSVDLNLEEAAEHLRELFLTSVGLHMRSDVPIGAALSGGIDSSAIVACMRHLEGDALDLRGVSFVADDPAISEKRWIDEVAGATAASIHEVRLSDEDLVGDLDGLIDCQGEPFGSTSIHAQYRVFREARQSGVTVMLDGQGADELLGGYRSYLSARLTSLLRRGQWARGARFLRAAQNLPGGEGVRLLYRSAGVLVPERWKSLARQVIGEPVFPAWTDLRACRSLGVEARPPGLGQGPDHLIGLLLESFERTSLPALLRYEDRNSMASSVESRVPFLTPEIVEFCFSLPEAFLISDSAQTKTVFRVAMRGLVPDPILDRKDKIGFQTPEASWLRTLTPWVEETLQSDALAEIPFLHLDPVLQTARDALAGRVPFSFQTWRFLNFVCWMERAGADFKS